MDFDASALRLVPRQTLSELLDSAPASRDYQAFLSKLDVQTQRAIASGEQARALKKTIESMLASAAQI